ARRVGVAEEDAARVYYLSLLRHVGCTAESDMSADFLGDEVAFRRDAITLDFTKPSAVFPYMVRHVGEGKSIFGRARHVAKMVAGSKKFMGAMDSVCETGQMLATRLGFDAVVQQGLWQIFEHWDGNGLPGRVGGDDIVRPARFVAIAELFEGLSRLEGPERAVAVIEGRRGTAFEPEIVDCLCREWRSFLPAFDQASVWEEVLATEPEPRDDLTDDQFDEVLYTIADFTDLKSTFMLGHSRGVADLAGAAGTVAGLAETDIATLRRAGLVHDIGRVGVTASVWGKNTALSRDEWEKVRLHPYYTERVLTRPAALAELGLLASTHHERLDGGGYHRAVPASVLTQPARILAAADGYRARIETRAHRPAMTGDESAASLRDEVKDGRLDPDAVEAVLQAAGHGAGRRRRPAQAGGLTDREREVLALVARGQSIRQIGQTLTISPKTADAHIQHIYTKLGVTTRAGATLWAVHNGVVDGAERWGEDRETSR
ncbi:MAG: HD domain-containing phosphohydrolase, partial [Actinomycetes bacterium]